MSTSGYFGVMAPAPHSRKKAQMVTALAEADTDAEFWPTLVARLSDGEFLSTLAEELKVNHSILRNWIRGNVKREQEYTQAEHQGQRHRMQLVMRRTYNTATAEIETPATRMEQLRAAEILLKQGNDSPRAPSSIANIEITFVQASDGRPKEKVIDSVP